MLESNKLNEQITSSDIASTEFWANVRDRFQQTQIPSLANVIFATYELKSPIAKVFNLTDDEPKKDKDVQLKLVSNTLEVSPTQIYTMHITSEALDDYRSMYRDPAQAIANALKGYTNRKESEDVIALLKSNAVDDGALAISDSLNSETQMFELTGKVNRCVLRMNSKRLRTFHAFAVMPYKYVASIMTTFAYTTGKDTSVVSDLEVAQIGTVTYYINPILSDNNVYVGLKHLTNKSLSAGIFGNYQTFITKSTETDTGGMTIHIHRRYGLAMSPLHTSDDPMLCKFSVSGIN